MRGVMQGSKGQSEQQNGNVAVRAESGAGNAFIKHLKHASTVVQTWPAWKRQILGAVFTQGPGAEELKPRKAQ